MTNAPAFPIARRVPAIPNGQLGMMLLVGSLTVLFSCFISAYMVLRLSAPMWPPPGTPILPLNLAIFNTGLLVSSALFALASSRYLKLAPVVLALGGSFVALQALEFQQVYSRGLTLRSGAYGAVFYTLIGCHAIHVAGGLVGWLSVMRDRTRLGYARLYWYFVTTVWLVLFGILYIL